MNPTRNHRFFRWNSFVGKRLRSCHLVPVRITSLGSVGGVKRWRAETDKGLRSVTYDGKTWTVKGVKP